MEGFELQGLEGIGAALLAGWIQGVSEWLPVSSKTLLLLLFLALGVGAEEAYLLGLFLNGSAAAAALLYFRRDVAGVLRSIRRPLSNAPGASLLRFLTASIITTSITAIPLAALSRILLEEAGGAAIILVGALLMVTGVLTWRRATWSAWRTEAGFLAGLAAGVAQGFSALPGISRSGITLFALLLMGYKPREALRLSFLMGIPATMGGALYTALTAPSTLPSTNSYIGPIAFLAAIAVSILTIDFLLRLSTRLKTYVFTFLLAGLTIGVGIILTMG